MATKSRLLSRLIEGDGSIKTTQIDSDAIGTSAAKSITAASGTDIYSSADTLPVSADNGDQALITSTNRLYIYSNGGWYNIALINSTPYWSSEANSSYVLSTTGTSTTITILAVDSEGIPITYTATTDSDFNEIATISKDSDNGRTFTITPTDSENGAAVSGSGTVTFKASDGVNLVSTLSTFNLTFISIVQNSNYTTLLAKADTASTDNQVDASTNTHTITEVGNVTSTALSPYHPGGYSTLFDGSTSWITVPDNASLDVGTGDFTIEAWIYLNVDSGLWNISSHAATGGMWFGRHGSGLVFRKYSVADIIVASAPSINTWHHIAVARSSGQIKMFVNGTQVGTTATDSTDYSVAAPLYIGDDDGAGPHYVMNGYIRDFRLVKGTGLYTANFTPPTEPLTAIANTSVLTCHLPYIADGSSNNHALTVNGNISTERFAPYDYEPYTKADYGGSVYFDGTGDNLSVAGNSDFNMGSDFTFECWCYSTSAASASPGDLLMLVWDGSSNNSVWVSYTSANKFEFRISYVGSWAMTLTSAGTFPINQWYHVAATRNSGTAYLFINGALEATVSNSTDISSTGNAVSIGSQGTGRYFEGYIADARIINGTAVYTSAFTPPTAPLTAITNTKLLTCTNKNNIWDAGSGTLLTKFGNLAASNTQRKFTTSSAIALDGTGDYLKYEDLKGTTTYGDFTIECFIYVTSLSNTQTVWDWRAAAASDPSGANFGIGQILATSGYVTFYDGTTSQTGNIGVPVNTWTHIAWVRNNGTISVYVDGVSSLSFTNTSVWQHCWTNYTPTIFANVANSAEVIGYVQGLRFAKEYARYTANFTPPTTEFTA